MPAEFVEPLAANFEIVEQVRLKPTDSMAILGEGLGTVGLPESKIRELYAEAGFSNVRHVPMENPFNILYEVTP